MDKYINIWKCMEIQDFDWTVRVYKAKWESRRARVGWRGIGVS